jgi:hypothetical protein
MHHGSNELRYDHTSLGELHSHFGRGSADKYRITYVTHVPLIRVSGQLSYFFF